MSDKQQKQKVVCRSGPWRAVVSRSKAGQIYYFNCKTAETTWDRPPIFDTSLPNTNTNNSPEKPLNKAGRKCNLKISPEKRTNNVSAPYSRRRCEDTSHKTDVKKETKKERKNLGSFVHSFHPPTKPSTDAIQEEQSSARVVSTSSVSTPVSLYIKSKKSPKIAEAPDSVLSEEEIENKSKAPSVTSESTSTPVHCLEPPVRTWLKDVPFGILNSSVVLCNQTTMKHQQDMPLYSAKQGREKQPENPAELDSAMQSFAKNSSEKLHRLRNSKVSLVRARSQGWPSSMVSVPRRRCSGLGEERMRRLREQLTEEVQRKEEDEKQPPQRPPQRRSQEDLAESTKRKGLLPTPPSCMRNDRHFDCKKDSKEPSREKPTKRGHLPTVSGVMALPSRLPESGAKSIYSSEVVEDLLPKMSRKRALPTSPKTTKLESDSNITEKVLPNFRQNQETLTTSDHTSKLKLEVPASSVVPAADGFEGEAMDVDEEAQVLSDIKALRTATTWESFDAEWTPMDTEIVGVSSNTTSGCIIVLDTNILLSHLSFVQDLRDTLKLNGDHPVLYLPWMVLQELDRIKESSSKRASSARAAVSFLNESFKRKHPRVRGQTGREATRARGKHLDELCPDDSILESCLQLQEQDLNILLLSNDISLCNKALVHDIKAATKIQLINEIRNGAETKGLLYEGISPPPRNKLSLMSRLRSASQPTSPHPITPQPVQSESVQTKPSVIGTKQTTSILENFKNLLLNTFTKVLSTGMEAVYGSGWTKRVLYQPPWGLHNVFICIAKHWFALCDSTTPEPVQKASNELRKIFQRSANHGSLDEIIDLTREISCRLPLKYEEIIAPLEKEIQVISSGSTNQCPDQNCQSIESQCDVSAVQSNEPPLDSFVLAYFGSLWNILHPFCTNLKQRLDSGIILDSDTLNLCKEMLSGTEELVKNITRVLSVPENQLDMGNPGLQGILHILRSLTPPPGAEPLQLEHVHSFCVQPKERLLLFNGLSQLEDCGKVIVTALKSGNNNSLN